MGLCSALKVHQLPGASTLSTLAAGFTNRPALGTLEFLTDFNQVSATNWARGMNITLIIVSLWS
jgi:hypothetical protein